jgi:hypothetical protein
MSNDRILLGKVSLCASLAGAIVVPVCFGILFLIVPRNSTGGRGGADVVTPLVGFALGGFLFVILELAGLACGISSRHTTAGQAGFIISGVLLGLSLTLATRYFFRGYLPF